MKKLSFILFTFLLLCTTSCNKHEHFIKLYRITDGMSDTKDDREINVTTKGASYLIKGGFGPYVPTCNAPGLVRLSIVDKNILNIEVLRAGEAELTITDQNNLVQKFKITTSEDINTLKIGATHCNVIGGDVPHASGKTIKEVVETEVASDYLMHSGGYAKLIYTANTSGDILVYKNGSGSIAQKGLFELIPQERKLIIELDGKTLNFQITDKIYTRKIGPKSLYLIEGLTKKYQDKFGSARITKVERIYSFTN